MLGFFFINVLLKKIQHLNAFFFVRKRKFKFMFSSVDIIECLGYDTESSNGEALVLDLWGMWSTTSLPLLDW